MPNTQTTARARQPAVDLSTCDREPIHIPGSIQPHGILLVLAEPDLVVDQVSANTESYFGRPADAVLGRPLVELLGPAETGRIAAVVRSAELEGQPLYAATVTADGAGPFEAVVHRRHGVLMLELEPAATGEPVNFHDLYPLVRTFVGALPSTSSVEELARLAAEEVRRITGFDRVLVYRFDEDWHGQVVAESRSAAYPSLLDHWFPASDIPHQARELYRLNRWRLIPDAAYRPVPLVPERHPVTGAAADLTHAALRSVSPVHLEYLHNMGVSASMSISVVRGGRLWGLIACHHATPRRLPFAVRTACDFLGQTLALQLSAQANTADYEHRMRLKAIQARLLASMAEEEPFVQGLARHPADLLAFGRATGVAVLFEGECTLVGETPPEPVVQRIVDWLVEEGRHDVFHTDCLPTLLPDAESFRETASGLLAISLSTRHRSFVLWFRPEVLRTIRWGGDPAKPAAAEGGRLHPRTSFETWRQTVSGRSVAWWPSEIDGASDLRQAIVEVVLRKAEELAELSAELARSNRELEAFSYSVSHDLRAPFRHIVGYAELLRERLEASRDPSAHRYIGTIVESAHFAGTLVDNLLSFSQIGRTALNVSRVNMNRLVSEVRSDVMQEAAGRLVEWRVAELPEVDADLALLRQAVHNLLANAVKYTRGRTPARIEVWSEVGEREAVFTVRDNGVGFEMQYVDKLFGVFQRLHRMEDFEGTGIGLANVRRIVARHGGRTWATGAVDAGASFYFSLPLRHQATEAP
ncbi:MAG TPA: ATP-binding protein [Gemmatimonadales bacterium]|nr:ATP-binding protein [Gemmatimonadales bacterium]